MTKITMGAVASRSRVIMHFFTVVSLILLQLEMGSGFSFNLGKGRIEKELGEEKMANARKYIHEAGVRLLDPQPNEPALDAAKGVDLIEDLRYGFKLIGTGSENREQVKKLNELIKLKDLAVPTSDGNIELMKKKVLATAKFETYPNLAKVIKYMKEKIIESGAVYLKDRVKEELRKNRMTCSGDDCFIKLDDLKDFIREELRNNMATPPRNLINLLPKDIGLYIMEFAKENGFDLENPPDETWGECKERFNQYVEDRFKNQCSAQWTAFKDEEFYRDELMRLAHQSGVTVKGLDSETIGWIETMRICSIFVDYEPFDLYVFSNYDPPTLEGQLFIGWEVPETPDETMEVMSERVVRKLEFLALVFEARHKLREDDIDDEDKSKLYREMYEATDCTKTCEASCFVQMENFAKMYDTSANMQLLFKHNYRDQLPICIAKTVENTKLGFSNPQLVAMKSGKAYLDKFANEFYELYRNSATGWGTVKENFSEVLAAHYSKNKLDGFGVSQSEKVHRFVESRFMPICNQMNQLNMLVWNELSIIDIIKPEEAFKDIDPVSIIGTHICRFLTTVPLTQKDYKDVVKVMNGKDVKSQLRRVKGTQSKNSCMHC